MTTAATKRTESTASIIGRTKRCAEAARQDGPKGAARPATANLDAWARDAAEALISSRSWRLASAMQKSQLDH